MIWCVSFPGDVRLISKLYTRDTGHFLMQRWGCHATDPTDALVCLAYPPLPGRWKVPRSLQTLGATEHLASSAQDGHRAGL